MYKILFNCIGLFLFIAGVLFIAPPLISAADWLLFFGGIGLLILALVVLIEWTKYIVRISKPFFNSKEAP